jgi:HK97 family phage portal protein/2'-5' RNA ligase
VFINNLLTRTRQWMSSRSAPASIRTQTDPNQTIALLYEPSGRVHRITAKSMMGGNWDGEYNALSQSVNRSGNATASEIGFAYISEINVWVRRCVEIRASNIKRLDWYVEDTRTGKRLEDHPLTIAMKRSRHFYQRSQRSLDIWGELYLKPIKNPYGYYSDVQWLNNLSVNLTIINGFISEFYYAPLHGGKPDKWPAREMCYIYTENAFDDLRGSSKILAVLAEANVHEEIARAAQAHFANDARPGIMFLPETDMGTSRAQEFIDFWKANFQGSLNTNKPVMLPSAIKSVQTLERAVLKDDVEMRGSIRREICAGFGVPLSVAGAWDDANYQSAPEQRISLYEETIIPTAEQLAEDYTRDLLPFYGNPARERVWFDGKNLTALAEDKQAKATALNSQLMSGGISVNEYREAMDMEAIPAGNVYYIPAGVIVTPADKLGTMPPPALPGASPWMSAPTVTAETPAALPAPAASEPASTEPQKEAQSLAVILSLENNVDLLQLQHDLKAKFGGVPIEWNAPDSFHITLVYAPAADETQAEQLAQFVAEYVTPQFNLNIGSLATFDSVGEHALHFRIRRDAALEEYQEDLYLACQQLGIQTGQYSTPTNWKPHVTMGYAKQRIPPVTFQSRLRVSPNEVQVSVERDGQYEIIGRAACGQPSTIQAAPETPEPEPVKADLPSGDPVLDELAAYEKFVLNRWGKPMRTFEFHVISGERQQQLVDQVKACAEKAQVKRLFEELRTSLKKKADDEDVVTPEQAQEWWSDYDRLMKALGNDWLRNYMREVWRKLQSRLSRDITTNDVQALLEDFHPDLIQEWTGTADEPGVIAKLYMAGMGAGQASLERAKTNMNPLKAAELEIDWDLVPSDAIGAVEKYVGKLIRGIDATTLADVQRIISQWLESGAPLDDLVRQLTPVFNDPDRAALIAQTESSNAYNSGAIQRWTDVGVTKMKFRTVQDSHVCDTCRPMAGEIGTLENGWNGLFIPVHPGCRCYATPVL